jgi:phosphoribosylamine--glycine ligase
MNVLILGSGGREHCFAELISKSKHCDKLFVAPGNSGTSLMAQNLDFSPIDFDLVKGAITKHNIQLVVVGPEDPLVSGIHDFIVSDPVLKGVKVIGPKQQAAQLEGSKDFAKNFLNRHNIPTAKHQTFTTRQFEEACEYIENNSPPYVLKADGLAAGKGVLIIDNVNQAKDELYQMLVKSKFGSASSSVVIEEFLKGIELSCFVLTDGKNYKMLPSAKDYKRIGEGDTGLNTGGMGAISPPPFLNDKIRSKIEKRIIYPTIKGFELDKLDYTGFVFFGLILVDEDPYVIEYNVRMGDPETQAVLPRINSDFLELLNSVHTGALSDYDLKINESSAATVVMVSGGYPETYEKNIEIKGLDKVKESKVYHAGVIKEKGLLKTNGGRVLAVTSLGENVNRALEASYCSIGKIRFKNQYYRKDIGFDL